MKTILEALYNGCIYPAEQIVPTSQEYRWVNRKISGAMELWKNRLSVDNYEELEALVEWCRRAGGMEAETAFVHGFKLGAMIMTEVLGEKEDILSGA